ncbi:MAG: TetR/AcrR family transcriptional regulator [Solirubrobacterales bacterium]
MSWSRCLSLRSAARVRERIEAAVFDLVLERGYAGTTVDAVCERAGVSPAAFERHFADLQVCVAAVYGRINDEVDREVHAAYDTGTDWRSSLRAAAYAAADYFATHPREVRFTTVAIMDAGAMVAAERDAALQRYVSLIDAGRFEFPDPDAIGRGVAESAVGAIFERMLKNASRGGAVSDARALVPELMYLAVRPYVGHGEAIEELSLPPPSRSAARR